MSEIEPKQKTEAFDPFLCNHQMCDAISPITYFFLLMLIVSLFPYFWHSSQILL